MSIEQANLNPLKFFTEFQNIFINLDAFFKNLLSSDTINGTITLNKEVWTFKELLEYCLQITSDNIKIINQVSHQLAGNFSDNDDEESIFVHKEIQLLKRDGLNLKYLTDCCKHFNGYLQECLTSTRLIKSENDFSKRIPKIYVEMSHYKVMVDQNIYYYILSADQNDIMMHMDDINHPQYKLVKQRFEYINIMATPELVKQALYKFGDLNNLAQCTIQKTFSKEVSNTKAFKELFWLIYYFFSSKKAEIETKVFQVNPCSEQVIEIWNLFSRIQAMKQFLKVSIPAITYHQKIYVPAIFDSITLKEIVERNTSGTMFENLKPDQNLIPQPTHTKYRTNQESQQQQQQINNPIAGNSENVQDKQQKFDKECGNSQNEWKDYNIFDKKSSNSIKVRILSNIALIPRKEVGKENIDKKQKKEPQLIQDIVYHIHGGGWVGLNTFSHQMYTRKWAKQLGDIPIFSVEYCQSPEHKYPKPIDDCWQVYQFLLNGLEEYFENVKIRKIIIAGDSAGGNMALVISMLALQRGIRRPDGLVLSYPALNIRMDFFTPSFVNINNEMIVPFNFLKVSLDSYMDRTNPQVDPRTDPFLSPLLFSDKALSLLPPMRIGCGEKDILRDDCIRFMYRLTKLNHNSKMILYRELTHGYLNLDLPMTVPATYKCGYDCGLFIQQLLAGEQLPPVVHYEQ